MMMMMIGYHNARNPNSAIEGCRRLSMMNIKLYDGAEKVSSVIQKCLPKATARKGLPPRASKCSFLCA